ncbi:hypothetical protein UPYG_G00118550 [Umbra pygmaea]|uniref:C1q domain-containing protein n=1 Tax=Umbra pygmaea TaxID=75934 RepID=A0ABD0XRY6_UMBPY
MRVVLALLLVLIGLLGESVRCNEEGTFDTQKQPDWMSELRHLRDIVMGQKAELTLTQAELKATKVTSEFVHLLMRTQLENMKKENSALVSRLTSTESQIEKLQKEIAERPKVAFSTSLGTTGQHGPFNVQTTVVYKNIFSNIGDNYSKVTGQFTAPVKGVYHFSFTIGAFLRSTTMGLTLYHNEKQIIHSGEWGDHQQFRYATNAVILQLEKGDVVFMQLPANYQIYDDSNHRNTFNGILLYTI